MLAEFISPVGEDEIVRAWPPCTHLDAVGLVRRFTTISDKAWWEETHREFKNVVDLALEWFKDKTLSDIGRQDISGFREMLQLLPKLRGQVCILMNESIGELTDLV